MSEYDFKDEPRSLTPGPVTYVKSLNDAQKAEDYRTRLKPILEQAAAIVTEARREGLFIGFNMIADQFGIQRVGDISVTKPL